MALKLNASARTNRRYLLVESENKEEIEKTILEFIGVLGWARAAPHITQKGKQFILAVDRKALNEVRAAFALSDKVKVIRVSGTIKSL